MFLLLPKMVQTLCFVDLLSVDQLLFNDAQDVVNPQDQHLLAIAGLERRAGVLGENRLVPA